MFFDPVRNTIITGLVDPKQAGVLKTCILLIQLQRIMEMVEALQEGRRLAREIQEKARLESQTSFEKAKANIEMEVQKAKLTLREEVANLSIRVAEKILTEKMDGASQEKKALEILGELEKTL